MTYSKVILTLISVFFLSCGETKTVTKNPFFNAADKGFTYSGRTDKSTDNAQALISSAAHVVFNAEGDSITFLLGGEGESHHYAVVEINGNYNGRFKVESGIENRYTIAMPKNETNTLALYKATEASNGPLLFYGVEVKNVAPANLKTVATIEFIGDSITCGFGADNEETHCGAGTWYDGHNAYLAYGPLSARSLNAEYLLSSVSGMGMYRNWNDEDTAPVIGDVYETTHLDGNKANQWDFSGNSLDLVSICLGTNDLSNGDGEKERKPFDSEKFTSNYIDFVKGVFERYPNTKLALLTSPMVSGDNNELFLHCLQKVKAHFDSDHRVAIFEFDPMQPNGCGAHPDLEDQKIMAEQLVPFYTNLLGI